MNIRHQADVDAPAHAVYDLIANPRQRVGWLPELHGTDAPDRRLEAGERFHGRSRLLLHEFLGHSEVVDAAGGEAFEEVVVIGARLRTRWELRPNSEGGTTVVHTVHVDFPGGVFGRVERWLLGRRLARMQRQALALLGEAVTRGQ